MVMAAGLCYIQHHLCTRACKMASNYTTGAVRKGSTSAGAHSELQHTIEYIHGGILLDCLNFRGPVLCAANRYVVQHAALQECCTPTGSHTVTE